MYNYANAFKCACDGEHKEFILSFMQNVPEIGIDGKIVEGKVLSEDVGHIVMSAEMALALANVISSLTNTATE